MSVSKQVFGSVFQTPHSPMLGLALGQTCCCDVLLSMQLTKVCGCKVFLSDIGGRS